MKRILTISLWVVAIGLWMPIVASRSPNPYQELYDEVLAPVVKVTTAQGTGSGVIIGTTNPAKRDESTQIYVLTAAHVVGRQREAGVYIYEYEYELPVVTIKTATVIITDTYKDLALLRYTSSQKYKQARLAPRNYQPYLFTEVYAVGCPLRLNPRPSEGIITSRQSRFADIGINRWEISAPVLPGNSGGGVFLKDTHELIGITVWVRIYRGQMITTMAGVVPIQQIYEFLKTTPLMNCEEHKSEGLTCWSAWGSECAIGIGGPADQPYLRKGVKNHGSDSFYRSVVCPVSISTRATHH